MVPKRLPKWIPRWLQINSKWITMVSSVHRNLQPEAYRTYVNEDAFLENLLVRKVYKNT